MLEQKVAAVGATKDVAGLKKAVNAIAKLKTPAAYSAIWDLAFAPPKLPFDNGLPFIALSALSLRLKREPAIRELFAARSAELDAIQNDAAIHSTIILTNWVADHLAEASQDPRWAAAIRRTLAWRDESVVMNAVFVLGCRLRDEASLPAIVEVVERAKPTQHGLVLCGAEAMVALPGVTAADLATLRAAEARLRKTGPAGDYFPPRIAKFVARLAKRLGAPAPTRAVSGRARTRRSSRARARRGGSAPCSRAGSAARCRG